MDGRQHGHAAVGGKAHGVQIGRIGDLIERQHTRGHGAHQLQSADRLRAAVEHVARGAEVKLRHSAAHGCQLAALVRNRHPDALL